MVDWHIQYLKQYIKEELEKFNLANNSMLYIDNVYDDCKNNFVDLLEIHIFSKDKATDKIDFGLYKTIKESDRCEAVFDVSFSGIEKGTDFNKLYELFNKMAEIAKGFYF